MRAIVIGGDSDIGTALASALASRGDIVCSTTRRAVSAKRHAVHLDLTSSDVDSISLPEADIAFFCAAITGFAACRTNESLARQVNVTAAPAGPSIGGGRDKGGSIINQRSLRLAFPPRAGKLPAMSESQYTGS